MIRRGRVDDIGTPSPSVSPRKSVRKSVAFEMVPEFQGDGLRARRGRGWAQQLVSVGSLSAHPRGPTGARHDSTSSPQEPRGRTTTLFLLKSFFDPVPARSAVSAAVRGGASEGASASERHFSGSTAPLRGSTLTGEADAYSSGAALRPTHSSAKQRMSNNRGVIPSDRVQLSAVIPRTWETAPPSDPKKAHEEHEKKFGHTDTIPLDAGAPESGEEQRHVGATTDEQRRKSYLCCNKVKRSPCSGSMNHAGIESWRDGRRGGRGARRTYGFWPNRLVD